jgi:hypothetical protein
MRERRGLFDERFLLVVLVMMLAAVVLRWIAHLSPR